MSGYSLESSLREQARKRAPAMDIVHSRKVTAPVLRTHEPLMVRALDMRAPGKKQRDIVKERQSLSVSLREFSLADTSARLWRKTELYTRRARRIFSQATVSIFGPHKMLYGSIVGGIAFGMVSMAFMEHYFGPGVFARSELPGETMVSDALSGATGSTSLLDKYNPEQDVFFEYFGQVTKEKYEDSIREMVKGYPIEAMLPYIFAQDRLTAAFLIGIAKKESNWGKRVPVLAGQDCFNYWGYRGVRRMMGTGGHTCFNSRKDAVETVTKRLETLIHSEKLNTPEKMIVWKCGFSCQGHSRESVRKWISDVDMYFSQLSDE